MTRNPFENLFIYDLANNHMGDVAHAERIIREVARVSNAAGVRGAIKFQFRQLDSFIHPDFRERMDQKYVKRFSETRLEMDRFRELAALVRDLGLFSMSTPFDEESVEVIRDMDLDLIKVASASADDHGLLEAVIAARKPTVVSTGGLRIDEIDRLVNHLQAVEAEFAIMHCVAIYPTPDESLQLDQVRQLKERYRGVEVGWSTHEHPDNTSAIQVAYALGARLFERHVGVPTDRYPLNAYSSAPHQLEQWLAAFHQAQAMIGAPERAPAAPEETATLRELKRGVFARRPIVQGEPIVAADVFFAIPGAAGGLTAGEFSPGMTANRDYAVNEPLDFVIVQHGEGDEQTIYQIMLQTRALLNRSGVAINEDAAIEISHHYGLARFREFGAVLIKCVNRDYAKTLVVQLPRQKHPYHFHKRKEETFQLLAGDLEIVKNGHRFVLQPGDTLLVKPGEWHKFHTFEGCVIEEISSTSFEDDSFYEDPRVARIPRGSRKTKVDHWSGCFAFRKAARPEVGRFAA